jgi:hypothetical protein
VPKHLNTAHQYAADTGKQRSLIAQYHLKAADYTRNSLQVLDFLSRNHLVFVAKKRKEVNGGRQRRHMLWQWNAIE